jgi:hypothetical protein
LEAHRLTVEAQKEAEAKLAEESAAGIAAAEAALKKRLEAEAAAAAKRTETNSVMKMQRAAELDRKRKAAEEAQRALEDMSAEGQRQLIEEQMKMIAGLEMVCHRPIMTTICRESTQPSPQNPSNSPRISQIYPWDGCNLPS